ncbi:hypothetical protein V1514DRAFT_350372 [Lipomyces japonicus]|uniref:uncharacterized protein n=1 Tax=Lipomyces japonicus TaxID=56871 RepID=UPI0034CEF859
MNIQPHHDIHSSSLSSQLGLQQPTSIGSVPPASPLRRSTVSPPAENVNSLLGFLPSSWNGSDESLRHALAFRAEEERRRAEEERTKQELHRLELRKKDLELFREGVRYGVPPSMLPFIFVGNGVTGATTEWIRDYVARIWQEQPQPNQQHDFTTPKAVSTSGSSYTGSQHHRSQSVQSLPITHNQGTSIAPPPPPPLPPPPPPPPPTVSTPSVTIGQAGGQQPNSYLSTEHSSGSVSLYPPVSVNQPSSIHSDRSFKSPPRSPTPPPQQQTTIQFYHWQPNTSTSSSSVSREKLPPLGNGIPRSPTRTHVTSDESSPKRRKQSIIIESSTNSGEMSQAKSPVLKHPSLPPFSSLSPQKRHGHVRHRSEATLHGYEHYPRIGLSQPSVPRSSVRDHRRTETAWDVGSVGVLAAAAESAERELKREMLAMRDRPVSDAHPPPPQLPPPPLPPSTLAARAQIISENE